MICDTHYTHPQKPNKPTMKQPQTAQPPYVQPVPVNPIERLSAIYYDMRKSRDLLFQAQESAYVKEMFTPGETGSIDAIIDKIGERMEFIKQLQRIL